MSSTIDIVSRKDKTNAKGEIPIYIRITKNRKVSYIATGQKIDGKFWDDQKRKVKNSHPNSLRLNHLLNNLKNKYQAEILEAEASDTTISSKKIKNKINGNDETNFFGLANQVIKQYLVAQKIATANRSISVLAKLKEFIKTENLNLTDINISFLKKYDGYLKENGNKVNTIHKDFCFIRRVFNEAYQNDLIPHEKNPFNKYPMKTERTHRQYLTEEEYQKIVELPLIEGSRIALHRDMFVFSAGAGGLRISDLLLLKWDNFDGTHIHFSMRKTKGQLSIKLPENAIKNIKKYLTKHSRKTDYIFPVLNPELDMTDAMVMHKAIASATAYINKSLKDIAKEAGIEKPISTHIARHTFATRALTKGVSLDKVSKLMGHSQTRETQIYAKIINSELDNAMDIFNKE